MILMQENLFWVPLEFDNFLGPEMATSKWSANWAQKSRDEVNLLYHAPPSSTHTKQFKNQQKCIRYASGT
jgi:hypothetical protein